MLYCRETVLLLVFLAFSSRRQIVGAARYSHLRQSRRSLTFLWRHLAEIDLSCIASIEGREDSTAIDPTPRSELHLACGFAVDTFRENKGVAVLHCPFRAALNTQTKTGWMRQPGPTRPK